MPRLKVCSVAGCPSLVPCPTHSRPANAPWSNRDKAAHARFARAVTTRAGHACERCGSSDGLQAHHIRPSNNPSDGIALCRRCHRQLDKNAR